MEITLAGGAVVDLASRDDLDAHHQKLKDLYPTVPRGNFLRLTASGAVPGGGLASGTLCLTFQPSSPPPGRIWFVQWVAIIQANAPAVGPISNVNAALMIGTAPVAAGAGQAGAGPVADPGQVVLPGLAVPSASSVPDKTVALHREQIYLLLAGSSIGSAGTVYNAVCGIIDVPDLPEVYFW